MKPVNIEERFVELWKELEHVTSLSFPEWNGREIDKFFRKMQVEGIDIFELGAWKNVRNALAHTPRDGDGTPIVQIDNRALAFVEKTIKIVKKIPTAWNVARPLADVEVCFLETPIKEVVMKMIKKSYSHIPVLDKDNRVIGVFSESTMLQKWQAIQENATGTTIKDFATFIPIDKHNVDRFEFIKKSEPLSKLRNLCSEVHTGKRLELFFVTNDGRANSPLLGIVTIWDFVGKADRQIVSNGGVEK